MLTVKPVSDIVPVKALEASKNPADSIFKGINPGRILKVEVLQGGKENILLQWKTFQFQAESKVPLQDGQKLDLLVTQNSDRIQLKVLGNLPQSLRGHLPLLTEKNILSHLLNTLRFSPELLEQRLAPRTLRGLELFQTFQNGPENLDLERIAELLRMLGMNGSKTVAGQGDEAEGEVLKSYLKEVLAGLKDADHDLGRKLETILSGLERNRLSGRETDAYYSLLPLPFLEKGFVVLERRARENLADEEIPWRLRLFLETESLGELRIDFLTEDNGLLLKFVSGSPGVQAYLDTCRDDFEKNFSAMPLRSVTFETTREAPGNEFLKLIAGQSESVLETYA